MLYLFYFFLGILPSIIWLLFFLRKDAHPESNRMILKIFLYGMFIAFPTIFIEIGFFETTSQLPLPEIGIIILNIFIGVALIEEILKYSVVKAKVLRDPELDEPIDLMLYMIIAALGFAAIENIAVLFRELVLSEETFFIREAIFITAFRFAGATFLHALSSALIGYFLAKSFFEPKQGTKYLILGFGLAIFLHGMFNSFIIMIDEGILTKWVGFTIEAFMLILFAVFVNLAFRKLKRLPSVSKVNIRFNI